MKPLTYSLGNTWGHVARFQTMHEVTEMVAARYGMRAADLVGPGRGKSLCEARFEAMWILRQQKIDGKPRLSYYQIGQFFGGRDHSSAWNGIRQHEAVLAGEPLKHHSVKRMEGLERRLSHQVAG